jgi:hypothetical protein
MYKSLASCAAVAMLAAFAASSPSAAADGTQATGVNTQQQNAGEEFSSQRRYRRSRVIVRRHWAPRRYVVRRSYWGPGPYAYPYAYAAPYPYYYRPGPFVSFGFGPFGFGVW